MFRGKVCKRERKTIKTLISHPHNVLSIRRGFLLPNLEKKQIYQIKTKFAWGSSRLPKNKGLPFLCGSH
jgi:hypothetical protein